MNLNPLILKEIAALEKQGITYGHSDIKYYSTGSLKFDAILKGGYVAGYMHQLAGDTQMGKTTLALLFIKTLLQNDLNAWALYFDVERRIEPKEVAKYDIDLTRFYYSDVNMVKPIFEGVLNILESANPPKAIVIDSIPFIRETKDDTTSIEKKKMGGISSTLSRMLKDWHGALRRKDTVILLLNSLHVNLGAQEWDLENYFWREGGIMAKRAPYSLIDLKYKKALRSADNKDIVGWELRPYTFKLQNGEPRQTAVVKVFFEKDGQDIYSVDTLEEIYDLGKELGILTKENGEPAGAQDRKLYYAGQALGSTKEAIKAYLAERSELTLKIMQDIQEAIKSGVIVESPTEDEVEESFSS